MAWNPLLIEELAAKFRTAETLLGGAKKQRDIVQVLEDRVLQSAARVIKQNGHDVRSITTPYGTNVNCVMDGNNILETNINSPIGSIFVTHNAGPIQRGIEATQTGIRNISAQRLEFADGTTQVNDRWNFDKYWYDFQTFLEEICNGQYVK